MAKMIAVEFIFVQKKISVHGGNMITRKPQFKWSNEALYLVTMLIYNFYLIS